MKKLFSLCISLSILAVVVLYSSAAMAQPLPEYFTTSNNAGTDFWMTFLPAWPMPGGINNIKIYVSSAVETEVTVDVKSEGFVKKKKIKPNEVQEFILPVTIAQPYYKIDRDPTPPEKVYKGHAVHVSSKDPIICYGVTRYQYTSDSFTALPTSALGTEYIISSFSDVGDNGTSFGQYLPSLSAVVGVFDNTKVVFTLGGNLITRTAGGMQPGESKTFTLNKGDVLMMGSFGKSADLSGSKVVATKPVGVISGNFCAYVPENTAACDHVVEMELPTNTWGKEFAVTKIFGRQRESLIKVMAKEPNTKIFLDDKHIYTIQTPGGTEGAGWLFRRVTDGVAANHVITADKPISITQHNPGQQDDNISSDPFQLVLTPMEQFRNEITFCTPGIGDGSGFTRNYVNLVFELDSTGEMPIGLEWASVENGVLQWASLGESFGFFFNALQDVGGRRYGVKTLTLPRDGVYKIRSTYRCAAYSYGFSDYDSYAMPSGVHLADMTVVDSTAPVSLFTQNCDGSIFDGKVSDPMVEEQRSNLAKVSMIHAASFNYTFEADDFVPGAASQVQWRLSVIDTAKPAKAVLLFVDRAGNTTIDSVLYSKPSLSIDQQQANFGSVNLRTVANRMVSLVNPNNNPITVDTVFLSSGTVFSVVLTPEFPLVVQPGASFNVQVMYSPSSAADPDATHRDTLIAITQCGGNQVAFVSGTGVYSTISVPDRSFGIVPSGEEKCIDIDVFNYGTDELTVTAINGVTSPYFIRDLKPALPVSIPPQGKITFSAFCFQSAEDGSYPLDITFSSNAWAVGADSVCVIETSTVTDVSSVGGESAPFTCYPNPATTDLRIQYTLAAAGSVRLEMYNAASSAVRVLYEGVQPAGTHRIEPSVADIAAGTYMCRLVTSSGVQVQTITIVK